MRYLTTIGDKTYTIDINQDGEVVIDGVKRSLDLRSIDDDGLYSLLLDNRSFEALVEEGDGEYRVLINGVLYYAQVADERAKRLAEAAGAFTPTSGEVNIKSPMPGLIVAVPVVEGQKVSKGQVVVVLESMKMENELKAPREGTVSSIKVQPRQAVEQNQVLVVLS
ncbi:MAG: biotin/lipoyl-binding protein [Anaerolineae bacterium]|jgi:biotin carboxyl carrier protein|nr:biotin/lipoyl-binding protein [Anaerolineae bacterium]